MAEWRVGRHYPIHVYEGDTPIATFFTAADAAEAVRDHNGTEIEQMRAHRDAAQRVLTAVSTELLRGETSPATRVRAAIAALDLRPVAAPVQPEETQQ